jgi:hypothetical protein
MGTQQSTIPLLHHSRMSPLGLSCFPLSRPAWHRVCTSPARFREHMQYLHDNGYRVFSLSSAWRLFLASCGPHDALCA